MKGITEAEMDIVLKIVKSPEVEYNANSLAKVVGLTPMGALKILKRLENGSILKSKKIGKAAIYRITAENLYTRYYVGLVLLREAIYANQQVKRWVDELKKVRNADIIMLFGSVLQKKNPNDIDLLFVTDKKRFSKLRKEIEEINKLSIKKIHPMYQTFNDIIENIKRHDKPLLNAIKGILVLGEEKFMEVYSESRKE